MYEPLSNIYTNFSISRKLEKRGFPSSSFNLPPHTAKWYSRKGVLGDCITGFPYTTYATVREWLEEKGVMFAVYRPQADTPFLVARVFVRHYSENGEEYYLQRGRTAVFYDFEEAEALTLERAILAVPLCDDDLPF